MGMFKQLKKLKSDNGGSVVMFIAFLMALGVGGFFYKVFSNVVSVTEADAPEVLTATVQYQTMTWFWSWGILILILIGLISHFLASLQKSKYERY